MNITRRTLLKTIGIGTAVAALPISALGSFVTPTLSVAVDSDGNNYRLVEVYSESDLPAPVDGVITLADNTEYKMMNAVNPFYNNHTLSGGPNTTFSTSQNTKSHTRLYSAIQKTTTH